MKTTTMRTVGAIFSAGILLTSCVSSKKYHRSEAEVAKLRQDSTTLAQQGTTLQQNLSSLQQKNSALQKSVDNANSTSAGLTKNVAYYRDYSEKQQSSTMQLKTDLSAALASSGINDQDVTLTDGKIYVNVGEKSLFKGNSAVLTSKGTDLVNNIGQFVKSHDGVDISVADLQQATAGGPNTGTIDNTMSSSSSTTNMDNSSTVSSNSSSSTSRNYTKTKRTNSNKTSDNTAANGSTGNTTAPADKTANKQTVAVHHRKRTQPVNGESKSVAYSSGHHNKYTAERNNRSVARAIAWKRQNAVTDALLKDGIPKVKVIAQNQAGTENANGQKGVQVILVNNMEQFYKHMSEAPAGQPVSANP